MSVNYHAYVVSDMHPSFSCRYDLDANINPNPLSLCIADKGHHCCVFLQMAHELFFLSFYF